MMKMLAKVFLGLTLLSLQHVEGQHYSYSGSYVSGYYSANTGHMRKYAAYLPFIPVYGGEPIGMSEPPSYSPEEPYEYTNDLDDDVSSVPNFSSNNNKNVNDTDQNDDLNDTGYDSTNNNNEDIVMSPPPPSNTNKSKQLSPTYIIMVIFGFIGYCLVCM